MNLTVTEKLQWMETRRGRNHPLDRMKEWLGPLGQYKGRAIHIAGTNGKGSSLTFLRLLLRKKGFTVGTFSSPHLLSHFERYQINGQNMPQAVWERLFDQYEPLFRQEQFTMFEMDLFLAMAWFVQEQPDWIIMETGMGGTYDATTALDYQGTLITKIGLDHMAFLGNTKAEIASAKAGILLEGIPCSSGRQELECEEVLKEAARNKKSPIRFVQKEDLCHLDEIWPSGLPDYQKENFLASLHLLGMMGFSFSKNEQKEVLEAFSWPARFMVLQKDPLILLDGAHNPDGIEALCTSIEKQGLVFKQIYFSVLADKQADTMIDRLQSLNARITLVDFDSYRLADLEALAKSHGLSCISFKQMADQLQEAKENTLICGSLYFASEVLCIKHN